MHASFVMAAPGDPDDPDAAGWPTPGGPGPWGPPENEVPGLAEGPVVVSRTEDVALVLWSVRAYRGGVRLALVLRLRRRDAVGGGHESFFETWQGLLVGVELADGRRAVADGVPALAQPGGLPQVQLVSAGGGGGDRAWSATYWLSPLPVGDLTLVTAGLPLGLPETRRVIAGPNLARAADAAVELWPWEPDPMPDLEAVRRARPIPAGGWFAETLGDP